MHKAGLGAQTSTPSRGVEKQNRQGVTHGKSQQGEKKRDGAHTKYANSRSSASGKKGEDRAVQALEEAGMTIIARNFRSKRGEIDIIALDGDVLAFIEVKTWSKFGMENLAYSLTPKKQRRIIETAKYFLSIYRQYYGMAIRFDVVFVRPQGRARPQGRGGKEAVTHLASAFMERI